MRLSEALLNKIVGKSGRVTCKVCTNKIILDGTEGEIRVKDGGFETGPLDLEEVEDFSEHPPSADPHLSELPLVPVDVAQVKVSAPPPLPAEARLRRSMKVKSPSSEDLTAAMNFSRGESEEFEAPAPDFRSDGSLSPHSMDEDEDDDSLVHMGREFNSSPFASERDETYNSLFPKQERKPAPVQEAPAYVSRAPSPPKRGELKRAKSDPEIFADEISTAPAIAATVVEMGPDGQLINKSDKKSRAKSEERSNTWLPWAVAAIALLGLGVSVTLNQPRVIVKTVETTAPATGTAAQPVEELEGALPELEEAPEVESDEVTEPAPEKVEPPVQKEMVEKKEATLAPSVSAKPSVASDSSDVSESEADGSESESKEEEGAVEAALPPFSSASAATAMREATALASACRKTGDPTGLAKVVVTFAPSGRVTRSSVSGAPYAGTQTGGCIASRFRSARVPAFSGQHVTVTKTVTIR